MNRRDLLRSIAGGAAAGLLTRTMRALAAEVVAPSRLGVGIHSFAVRQKNDKPDGQQPRFADPLNYLEHCHRFGAGGIQIGLGARDESYATALRRKAEIYGMFVEGSSSAPRDGADADRFAAELRTAAAAGAKVVRIVMLGGRRYETFETAAAFREFADKAWKSMQLAAPLAAKHGVRLAIENHKDWRADELLDGLKRLGSERVGACIDTGNNIALLEDPAETVKTLAPAAMSVHLKDMAVRPYDDGFLLAEVPLGEGVLNLPAIVATVKQARPEVRFSLEMMTRDPLRVPCLTEKYWATFAAVSGRDLARTLRWVRDRAAEQPLPRISQLPLREQLAREEENVRKCLKFAADRLRL